MAANWLKLPPARWSRCFHSWSTKSCRVGSMSFRVRNQHKLASIYIPCWATMGVATVVGKDKSTEPSVTACLLLLAPRCQTINSDLRFYSRCWKRTWMEFMIYKRDGERSPDRGSKDNCLYGGDRSGKWLVWNGTHPQYCVSGHGFWLATSEFATNITSRISWLINQDTYVQGLTSNRFQLQPYTEWSRQEVREL